MLQQLNPKNKDIKVYVNGEIMHRDDAKVSVFDSVVQGGDAVWEGIRVYDGRIFHLDHHLERLQNSAHALDFKEIPTNETITDAIFQTLKANNMRDGVHIRLTLTRGRKITSGMDPRLNKYGCTLIVLAEWQPPVYPPSITLATSSVRRNSPMHLDSKIHHNNLLNNILAKIEANYAGADAGLAVFVVQLYLDTYIQRRQVRGTLSRQALCGLELVDGVNPVKVLGDEACFITLQVADEMPHEIEVASLLDLGETFLDEVLAKIALPGCGRGANLVERLFFAHCEQADRRRISFSLIGRLCQQTADQL